MALSEAQVRMLKALADGPVEGAVLVTDYGPRRGCPEHLWLSTADRTLSLLVNKGMVTRIGDGAMSGEYELTERGARYVERH